MMTAGPEPIGAGGLLIRVSRGTGEGRTQLAAFDAALRDAGVADFNLIRLSSVIPAGSEVVVVDRQDQLVGAHGDRLYCVYAAGYASTPGDQAWAGIAWSTHLDGSRGGLFVEHVGSSRHTVEHDLAASLEDMSEGRGSNYRTIGSTLASIRCSGHPVCALVVASYQRTGWADDAR